MWFNCFIKPGIDYVHYFAEKVERICVYMCRLMWFNCFIKPGIDYVHYFAENVDEICVYVRDI